MQGPPGWRIYRPVTVAIDIHNSHNSHANAHWNSRSTGQGQYAKSAKCSNVKTLPMTQIGQQNRIKCNIHLIYERKHFVCICTRATCISRFCGSKKQKCRDNFMWQWIVREQFLKLIQTNTRRCTWKVRMATTKMSQTISDSFGFVQLKLYERISQCPSVRAVRNKLGSKIGTKNMKKQKTHQIDWLWKRPMRSQIDLGRNRNSDGG